MQTSGQDLLKGTVILDVTFRHPGETRRARNARVQTESADQRRFRTNKLVLDSERFKECVKIEDETYGQLQRWSLPSPLEGYFFLPAGMIAEVYEYLDRQDARLAAKVEELVAELPEVRAKAERDLKEFWDERQFPTEARLREGIRMDRRLVEFSVPSEGKVGAVIGRAEQERARRLWDEAARDAILAMRESLAALVGHLAERLAPAPDGGKKRLHESAIEKLNEFLNLFGKRNVMEDDELAAMAAKARVILAGKDAELLRDNGLLRARTAAKLVEVKGELDKLVERAPGRRIVLDE